MAGAIAVKKKGGALPHRAPGAQNRKPIKSASFKVVGGGGSPAHKIGPVVALIHKIEQGLPFRQLEQLRENLGVPLEELGEKLGLSRPTLYRRKAAGRLSLQESDRLVRFSRLFARAAQVLETPENARAWLLSPQYGLGGRVPLDFAVTEVGAREVEDLLERIDQSVYS